MPKLLPTPYSCKFLSEHKGPVANNISGVVKSEGLGISRRVIAINRDNWLYAGIALAKPDGSYVIPAIVSQPQDAKYIVLGEAEIPDDFKSVLADKVSLDYYPPDIVAQTISPRGFDAGNMGRPGVNVDANTRRYSALVSESLAWFNFEDFEVSLTPTRNDATVSAYDAVDYYRRHTINDLLAPRTGQGGTQPWELTDKPSSLSGKSMRVYRMTSSNIPTTPRGANMNNSLKPALGSSFSIVGWCSPAIGGTPFAPLYGMCSGARGWFIAGSTQAGNQGPMLRIYTDTGAMFQAQSAVATSNTVAHLISAGVDNVNKKLWIQVDGNPRVEVSFTGNFTQDPSSVVFTFGYIGYAPDTESITPFQPAAGGAAAVQIAGGPFVYDDVALFGRQLTSDEHLFLYNSGNGRFFYDHMPYRE